MKNVKHVYTNCLLVVDQSGCLDPGSIVHAKRSGSSGPYPEGSKVIYTCHTCYTGGGTMTCQDNGQWSNRPECRGKKLFLKKHFF